MGTRPHSLGLRLLGSSALLMLAGCLGAGLDTLPHAHHIAIVAAPGTGAAQPIRIANLPAEAGTTAGGVGGGVAGAAAGLGTCILWGYICLPIYIATAGAGGFAGAKAGKAFGEAVGAPREKLEDLVRRIEAYERAHNPHLELVAAITERAKSHWQVVPVPESAAATITVEVTGISLASETADSLAVRMAASISVRHSDASRRTDWAAFRYESPATEFSRWIEDDEFIETSFKGAYQQIADNVVRQLTLQREPLLDLRIGSLPLWQTNTWRGPPPLDVDVFGVPIWRSDPR